MAGSLITIGRSGALAARAALELTGQNIANAGNANYTHRTLGLAEVAATSSVVLGDAAALGGVRASGVQRGETLFLGSEVRRTGTNEARAVAELAGLLSAESAIEQAGVYPATTDFEASLGRLASDPLNNALRTDTLETARALTRTFGIAIAGLNASADSVRGAALEGVAEINRLAAELTRTNAGLARVQDGSAGKAVLLDRRDALLASLAGQAQIATEFDASGRVGVRLGGPGGPGLVAGAASATMTVAQNADGGLAFAVDGAAVTLGGGALAGQAQALDQLGVVASQLDAIAAMLIDYGNTAQANGITPAGTAGAALFAGSDARTIALADIDVAGLATAPAGSGINSRNTGNLDALRTALNDNGPAAGADRLLASLSSAIAARSLTRDVLTDLADAARSAMQAETGVDLDAEAANLLRFQQAFQANGKVIQAATEIFDTMLGIG